MLELGDVVDTERVARLDGDDHLLIHHLERGGNHAVRRAVSLPRIESAVLLVFGVEDLQFTHAVISWIALAGHSAQQMPQPWHKASSISLTPSSLILGTP